LKGNNMFSRACVFEGAMERQARVGDGWLANPLVTTNAASGNQSITVAMIAGGSGVFTGAAGAVNLTFPTASDILAAFPQMDIGDSLVCSLTNTAAQAATFVANTGNTLAGFATTNANTRWAIITKTAATTTTITII
jgi:hypothetical protein